MFIYTTISKNYVSNWGMKEGVREIMQNALDSHDQGQTMGVTYVRSRKALMVFNRGASLEREALLLGSTSKSEDPNQRGKWGEGFKVGSLALVRAGKTVTVHNGESGEKWEALIRPSKEFDCDVLSFKITKHEASGKLLFEVGNVTPEEWHGMTDMFLNIYAPAKETMLVTPDGVVLLDKKLKGKVYCGGIYVDSDKDLEYGYNFPPSGLQLNRDRNMVASFELRWNTSKLWAQLCASKKGKLFDVTKMLKKGVPDVEYLKQFSDYTLQGKVVEDFFKENSERAYPVTSDQEAKEVRGYGYSPVYSSSSYSGILREKLGTIEDLKRTIEMDYSLFQAMTPLDDASVQWVFEVMWKIDPKHQFKMKIAKFNLDSTRSIPDKEDLVINCNLLQKKYEILHEAIKHYCTQGGHQDSQVWKKLYQQTVDGMAG